MNPFFQQRLFFSAPLSLVRGKRRWSSSGVETVLKGEVTQEELVKRDTPPGASCRDCFQCGGVFGADVLLPRQRCVGATPGVDGVSPGFRPVSGYSGAGVSRSFVKSSKHDLPWIFDTSYSARTSW